MNPSKWEDNFHQAVVANYDGEIINVSVGGHELECVVASKHTSRVRGLAEHTELPRDGMLFIYNGDHNATFSRAAMSFDISIWFFDAAGALVGQGWSGDHSVNPSVAYRYVLETHVDLLMDEGIEPTLRLQSLQS